jgi:hypothetical protein
MLPFCGLGRLVVEERWGSLDPVAAEFVFAVFDAKFFMSEEDEIIVVVNAVSAGFNSVQFHLLAFDGEDKGFGALGLGLEGDSCTGESSDNFALFCVAEEEEVALVVDSFVVLFSFVQLVVVEGGHGIHIPELFGDGLEKEFSAATVFAEEADHAAVIDKDLAEFFVSDFGIISLQ